MSCEQQLLNHHNRISLNHKSCTFWFLYSFSVYAYFLILVQLIIQLNDIVLLETYFAPLFIQPFTCLKKDENKGRSQNLAGTVIQCGNTRHFEKIQVKFECHGASINGSQSASDLQTLRSRGRISFLLCAKFFKNIITRSVFRSVWEFVCFFSIHGLLLGLKVITTQLI